MGNGSPERVRDACGVVLVASLRGEARSDVLPLALGALGRLAHRGAVDAGVRTGDGAGVLTRIPFDLLQPDPEALGLGRRERSSIGVGMVFLPWQKNAALRARAEIRAAIAREGLLVAGWRPVPVEPDALGEKALLSMPRIERVFVLPRTRDLGDGWHAAHASCHPPFQIPRLTLGMTCFS